MDEFGRSYIPPWDEWWESKIPYFEYVGEVLVCHVDVEETLMSDRQRCIGVMDRKGTMTYVRRYKRKYTDRNGNPVDLTKMFV